jgi:hypothetical protein
VSNHTISRKEGNITLRAVIALFALIALFCSLFRSERALAASTLTITPLTWNIIGLDSNDPDTGPRYFPIGARVCSSAATTNVQVAFVWDSANPNVDLKSGT